MRSGADYRDLYLIVAGIVLGILLGPGVLGRIRPGLYGRLFVGPSTDLVVAKFSRHLAETNQARQNLIASGATTAPALEEFDQRQQREVAGFQKQFDEIAAAQQAHAARLGGWALALVLATMAVMVIESVVDEQAARARGRLATARYALMALWVALLIAQPALLKIVPPVLLIGLIVVAVAAALVPLGKRG